MKRFFYLMIAGGLFLSACYEDLDATPNDVVCTQEFRSVEVKFKNKAGEYILVEDFKAVIKRTGQLTNQGNYRSPDVKSYIVATDLDKKLLAGGETIVVSATDPATEKYITAEFTIGADQCHINKGSGPEEVLVE